MTTAIELIHSSNGFLPSPGDTINDFVAVTNLGTHVIDTVTISSNLGLSYTEISSFDPSQGLEFNIGDADSNGLFDSGETWYYSSLYEISQEDLDSNGASDGSADGALTNTITVTASGPGGTVTRTDSISIPLLSDRPSLSVRVTGSPDPAGIGDTLTYAIAVRNDGNRDLYSLTLTGTPFAEPTALRDPSGFNLGDNDQDGYFDVGETWHYSSSHVVSQADLDNQGAIDGTADGALTFTVAALASLCGEGCSGEIQATDASTVALGDLPPPMAAVELVKTARIDSRPCHDGDGPDPDLRQSLGGIDLGGLTDYLFVFADGRVDANWQGASKGFAGHVAVDGLQARERTSGNVPFAGTLTTNDRTAGAWQAILDRNAAQAQLRTNQVATIAALENDLVSAIQAINGLEATATSSIGGRPYAFSGLAATALNGFNSQDGIGQTFVINVTSGFTVKEKIAITGDANDVFVLRWDSDANPGNGYQGQVKFQSGGAIVPRGGLTAGNFIHVAGDLNSSGGGSTPAAPFPQGPVLEGNALIAGGSKFSGGGFFTGYWLTTGAPSSAKDPLTGLFSGPTAPFSNAIFVGGWYTLTTRFSLTSGSSGVHVDPNPCALQPLPPDQQTDSPFNPDQVGSDGGTTNAEAGDLITYSFRVRNTGSCVLTNLRLVDDNATPTIAGDDYAPTAVRKANGNRFGDDNDNGLLDPGEAWFFQSKRYVGACSGTLTNSASVYADVLGGGGVQDRDSAVVQVLHPEESCGSGWS